MVVVEKLEIIFSDKYPCVRMLRWTQSTYVITSVRGVVLAKSKPGTLLLSTNALPFAG